MKKVKKTARKKKTSRAAASGAVESPAAEAQPASGLEASPKPVAAEADSPSRTAKQRASRGSGTRGRARKRAVAVEAPAEPAEPQVEQQGEALVVRFPPVGLPPAPLAATPMPMAHAPVAVVQPLPPVQPPRAAEWADEPAERDEAVAAPQPPDAPAVDERLREAAMEILRQAVARGSSNNGEAVGERGAGEVRAASGERDERELTPSQKRRLRRRRRGRGGRRDDADAGANDAPRSPSSAPLATDADDEGESLDEIRSEPTLYDADAGDESAAPIGGLDLVEAEPDDEGDESAADVELLDSEEPENVADVAEAADVTDTAGSGAAPEEARTDRREPREGRRRRRRGGRRGRGRTSEDGADARTFEARDAEMDTAAELERDELIEIDTEADEAAGAAPRRASTKREMIINVVPREECRIAILEDGKLEEIYLERASAENHVGNIYKGIVTNVEPSIQAAFIDFGLGKNGFLHISDVDQQYFPHTDGQVENVGRKMPRRNRPPIQRCLRRGQELLVQITKEGIGTKGPTLTTYLAIPGRFLVMMPSMRKLGVSRKIEDEDLRGRVRELLAEMDLPADMGFIARTAAAGRSRRELQGDLTYLSRLWKSVTERIQSERAPAELYRESDLLIRTIRDVFTSDIDRILVDDHEVAERAREFLSVFSPRSRDAVVEYAEREPIFHKYGIEAELERLHSRHVPMRSGGSLVIDQAEALVAIDVNSGRYRAEDDAESTAYKMNLEAADEIPRQLRLRDLGGVIICDFIDMRIEKHRREVERRLVNNLKKHKERAKVLRMSQFGIIEMTRQRQRASLTRSVYQDCQHCRGTGLVKTNESVTLDVMRLVQLAVAQEHIRVVEVTVSPEVAVLLQNRKRSQIHQLEHEHRRTITIRPDPNYGLDQVQVQCFDARGRLVPHT